MGTYLEGKRFEHGADNGESGQDVAVEVSQFDPVLYYQELSLTLLDCRKLALQGF